MAGPGKLGSQGLPWRMGSAFAKPTARQALCDSWDRSDRARATFHLSPLNPHDIGVASTCGSLCCSRAILLAAAVTSASVKSALITTVA
jgi:hypothetical protein